MKLHRTVIIWVLSPLLMLGMQSAATATTLIIKGKEAKHLYNSLTRPKVKHEGAAGHLYSQGSCILCRYTDVDIEKNGKSVPQKDPSRYACSMKFNHTRVSPGQTHECSKNAI